MLTQLRKFRALPTRRDYHSKKYGFIVLLCSFTVLLSALAIRPATSQSQAERGGKEQPPPYRWPLDIYNGYSRSFQEFGSNHFHAGLDLRTLQKTGFPVYAISKGKIVRIRMAKRGSGRGLYLRHDDGCTSVYFHLEKFCPRLEAIVKQVQIARGRKYFGNYNLPQPLPMKKGELIAYSGETGAGFPHLHLEIRDAGYFALNPFPLLKFPGKDTNFPIPKGILLRNRGDATINGDVNESYHPFISMKNHGYTLREPLLITGGEGCFEPVFNVFDVADTGKHVAPRQISAYIDGQRYFHLDFDRFEGDDNNQLGFVYDMLYSMSTSYFFNLFFQDGYNLESEKINLDNVLAGIAPGEHRLTIRVADHFNNSRSADVPFLKLPTPLLEITGITKSDRGLTFNIDKLHAGGADKIGIKLFDWGNRLLYRGELARAYHNIDKRLPMLLKNTAGNSFYMDFVFTRQNRDYYRKRFLLDNTYLTGMSDITFDTFLNRDDIYITVDEPALAAENLVLHVIQGKDTMDIPAQSTAGKLFFRFQPQNFENQMLLRFKVIANGQLQAEIQKQIEIIHLVEGNKQTFSHGDFQAEFYERAVYEPKVLLVEEKNFASNYPVESEQISLSPYQFPFLDTVYFKFKKKLEKPRQVGIFQYHTAHKKWYYVSTTYDRAVHTFTARRITPGIFALMRDIYKPSISFYRPRTKYLQQVEYLTVVLRDSGKGIDDTSLVITINGQAIDGEYDPDRSRVMIEDLDALVRGENKITIRVKDYAGNLATKAYRFTLN